MGEHPSEILCGAVSALLATAVTAVVANYDWTPERLRMRDAANREGFYASSPEPEHAQMPSRPRAAGPETLAGSRPAQIWLREMRRAQLPSEELGAYFGQVWAESRMQPDAVSPVGARGLAQGMPRTTAQEYPQTSPSCAGVDPHEPGCSSRFQVSYNRRIEGWLPPGARTPELRQAAYNWGIGNVRQKVAACTTLPGCTPTVWSTIAPMMPEETRNYISRIAEYAGTFRAAAAGEDWQINATLNW